MTLLRGNRSHPARPQPGRPGVPLGLLAGDRAVRPRRGRASLVFILVERRAKEPILPFDLFQNRTYVVGNTAALLIAGVGFFGAIIFLPIYMVVVVGVSASAAGLTVMPLTLGVVVSSFVSGQIVSRVGKYKVLLLVGAAIVLVGYFLMQGLTVSTSRWEVSWRMIILGLGLGPALPIYTPRRAELGESARDRRGNGQQPVLPADRLHHRGGRLRHHPDHHALPRSFRSTCRPEMRSPGTAAVSFNMGQLSRGTSAPWETRSARACRPPTRRSSSR